RKKNYTDFPIASSWHPELIRNVGNAPVDVFIGDADNDGYNDIITANTAEDTVSILRWNENTDNWRSQIKRSVGGYPNSVFISDANNDGYNDIITANPGTNDVSIYLWNYNLSNWDPVITKVVGDIPANAYVGDANNDGFNDIITANYNDNNVSILLWNNNSDDWDTPVTRSVKTGPYQAVIGDANNDGYNDIVTANNDANNISILLWNENSDDWDHQITKPVGLAPMDVFIGDANNDGFNDIITCNWDPDTVSLYLWNALSSDWDYQELGPLGRYGGPHIVFVGDANNDGYNDILTGNADSTLSILLWNPLSNNWGKEIRKSLSNVPYGTFVGDASNDGLNDIVFAIYSNDQVTILLGKKEKIDIISPQNKIYSEPMSGYYPATYGFENDEDGAFPNGWLDLTKGTTSVTIWPEKDGHKKVLRSNDDDTVDQASADVKQNFTAQYYGTVEFWVYKEAGGTGSPAVFKLKKNDTSTPVVDILIDDSNYGPIFYAGGYGEFGAGKYSDDQWFHLRIDFDCSSQKYDIYLDGIKEITQADFAHSHFSVGSVHLSSSWSRTGIYYIDALGYSWDPKYNIGDNFNEGLLLGFTSSSNLDWMGYSLDKAEVKTILGNCSIPIPDDGEHSIQVFGNDSFGEIYSSDEEWFIIDIVPSIQELNVGILDLSFTKAAFNITFFVYNETNHGIDFASIQIWWNETEVSGDVQNLGNGLYFISLEPITVSPGEDPILLKMTIIASGYEEKNFETYIAVDPDTLQKGEGRPSEEVPLVLIIIISAVSTGAVIGLISIFWYRRRKREL
ncbi:MAG: FG-GAP-like repeat-containing protein, partial [Promethearchaeota archaeon]